MLFYRVKSSSDGKPYLVRRRGGIEYWSAIVAGELFTPNEVAKVATARPIYMPGTKPNHKRGELKVVRS